MLIQKAGLCGNLTKSNLLLCGTRGGGALESIDRFVISTTAPRTETQGSRLPLFTILQKVNYFTLCALSLFLVAIQISCYVLHKFALLLAYPVFMYADMTVSFYIHNISSIFGIDFSHSLLYCTVSMLVVTNM
jgi:hypothetical protein